MSISTLSPHLRDHPAVRASRALFCSTDNPVGSPSLLRLRLAYPAKVQALLYQALDTTLWLSGQSIVRLRMLNGKSSIRGLLVLSNGCLCTFDLNSNKQAVLAFEIHGRRGMVNYRDADRTGIWLFPVSEPARNLWAWTQQCLPRIQEVSEFPSEGYLKRIGRAALSSLTSGKVWEEVEDAT